MKSTLLLVFALGCMALAADDIKSFKIEERRGSFIERSTYWFRGEQCVACIRGYADTRKQVVRFREFLDIFHAGKRIATCDPEAKSMLHVSVPERVVFQKDFMRFTIHSKDFSYFEQMTVEPANKEGFGLSIPDAAQLATARETFQARTQHSPEEDSLLRSYTPREAAPTVEEIQTRAGKGSK